MNQSINSARSRTNDKSLILALDCKLCELLEAAGRYQLAIEKADETLKQLDSKDWRQLILTQRLLDVKKHNCINVRDYNLARELAKRICTIDDELMGSDSPESLRRRVDLIELIFAGTNFEETVAAGEALKKQFENFDAKPDLSKFRLLAYLGVAHLALGNRETGTAYLKQAAAMRQCIKGSYLPSWTVAIINCLGDRELILRILEGPP